MTFLHCLEALTEKTAGLGAAIKNLALTEVPGTKPWVIGNAQKATRFSATGKAALSGAARPAPVTRRAASGAYDVSEMARRMGV